MSSLDTETPDEEQAPDEEADGLTTVDLGSSGPDLTPSYDPDELAEIGLQVCEDFEADCESCEEHLERSAKWNELYNSAMKVKSWPFEGAANVNVPVLTTATLQVHGRVLDQIIPAKGNIYNCVPVQEEMQAIERANRCELQANYWARHECTEFMAAYDAITWRCLIYGSAFSALDWDDEEERATIECVPIEDMVVPYNAVPSRPDMKNVPRYSWVRRMSQWDIDSAVERGFFRNVEELDPEATGRDDDNPIATVRAKISGMSQSGATGTTSEDNLRKVIIHYRKLALPSDGRHQSFDGKAHAVRIWVDYETQKVLRIALREMPDPRDAARFQRETTAYMQFMSQVEQWKTAGGMSTNPMTGEPLPIPMPKPVPQPKPQRVVEITFHTHYRAFNSEGFYGLGYGDIVGPLNMAMNSILNQRLDLQTLNNAGGGFRSKHVRFPSGPNIIKPGLYVEIDATPSMIKEGIIPRPIIPGDPATPMFIDRIDSWYQRATGSGDTLSGEPSKSNETATAATARYDAANKQISILSSRIVSSYMKNDADMLWRLFATYLPDGEYRQLLTAEGAPVQVFSAKDDFAAGGRVFPVADPRVINRQDRVNAAASFMEAATKNPLLAQNPRIMYEATKKWLAANDLHEVVSLLQPPQPPQPPPPQPQTAENADFLLGKNPPVNPADNDEQHLADISMFKNSPEAQSLTPEMSNALDQHARGHVAAKMKKGLQNGQGQVPQGVPGMANIGGNPGTGLLPPGGGGGGPGLHR